MEKQAEAVAARAQLLEKAQETSSSPGVYLMKDETGAILYVGKAKNLRNRLCTYFQPAPHEAGRTEMMVRRVARFRRHSDRNRVRGPDSRRHADQEAQAQVQRPAQGRQGLPVSQNPGGRGLSPDRMDAARAAGWRAVLRAVPIGLVGPAGDESSERDLSPAGLLGQHVPPPDAAVHPSSDRPLHRPLRGARRSRKVTTKSLGQVVAVLEGKTDRLVAELRRGMEDAASSARSSRPRPSIAIRSAISSS